jgi:FMN phosphatase YigB (HAD superfamily)
MIPKAVVFDLGKVLVDFDYGITVRRIQRQCRLSMAELQALLNQSPLLHRYESNLLSTAEFFAEIQAASGFAGTFEEFRGTFADIFSAIEPMVALHGELHDQEVPTFVLSNTNELAIQHIREHFPFFANFTGYIFSYEHNAMKPEPALYEVVERAAGRQGPELLYIDDRPENLATAQSRGWQTILHTDPQRTIEAVRNTGLLHKRPTTNPGTAQFLCKTPSRE